MSETLVEVSSTLSDGRDARRSSLGESGQQCARYRRGSQPRSVMNAAEQEIDPRTSEQRFDRVQHAPMMPAMHSSALALVCQWLHLRRSAVSLAHRIAGAPSLPSA